MWIGRIRHLLAILAAAAVYYALAQGGFALAFLHGTVSAVWPPTGFALALLVLAGPRMWPAVLIGECACDLHNGSAILISLAFACGSTLEAVTGAWLLRRAAFRPSLQRVRDVFALLGYGALLSTVVSATVGTGTLWIAREITVSDLWSTWHVWWLGDVTGDVILAPLLMVLVSTRAWWPRGWRAVEAVAFLAALGGLAAIAHSLALGIAYLVLPVLIWAALRFRQPGAVLANGVLGGVGILVAASAAGQLNRVSTAERVLFTQNFMVVGAITTLVLAAVIAERDSGGVALARSEATASALARERTADQRIATAIARGGSLETVLALIAEQASGLIGAPAARVIRIDDGTWITAAHWPQSADPQEPADPGVATPIAVGELLWGVLQVDGGAGGAETERILESLAELATLAVVTSEARRQLLFEATTDPLTGLVNQREFGRRVDAEIERAQRYGRPMAVALIDVDAFKAINDTAGHLQGDRVLNEVARRITATVRGEALVARLGGDEFALVLPECDDMQAYAAAERARRAIAGAPICDYGPVTVSVGIAGADATSDRQALRQLADEALYAAKQQGRNRCVLHSPELSASLREPAKRRAL